ncbi:hypothetical protein T484DRAFT_1938870 [Baffinella frigidus]|jgi:hypothetical protein|nr:hypothetical protein T484DRAFT_1938870 [Cryptophyta sp. CCMP2293]
MTLGMALRVVGRLPGGTPGKEWVEVLLTCGRRLNTQNTYSGALATFWAYCNDVQIAAGLEPLSFLPASQATIVGWLAWMFEQDSVHHSSLKVYMSAVNQLHADHGYDRPCIDHHVRLAAKGFKWLEAQRGGRVWARGAASAAAIYLILLLGLATADPEELRAATGVILCFVFCLRPDSLVLVKEGNLSLRADGLHILAGGKNIDLLDIKGLTLPWPQLPTGGPDVHRPSPHRLLQRYLACFTEERRAGDFALRLVGDPRGWQASRVEAWLASCLKATRQEPPPGVLWTMYSLRSGAATAAHSIGVSLPSIQRWGLWKSLGGVEPYIDALVQPSSEALLFFGHLRRSAPSALPPYPS